MTAKLNAKLRMWIQIHIPWHVIRLEDMATGESDRGVPVTGWRWRCVLCGREFDVIEDVGLDQIARGVPRGKAVSWMGEEKK